MKIMEAIREYGINQWYDRPAEPLDLADRSDMPGYPHFSSHWQFEELSKIFKPICYQKGSCQFLSDVDRACTIRDRVQANAKRNRPSSEWHKDEIYWQPGKVGVKMNGIGIHAIEDSEWMLDPTAARVSQ